MKISAGVLVKFVNKYLLCHPTKSSWLGTYSPPKGIVENGESILDAAIREFREETSIEINLSLLKGINPVLISYTNSNNKVLKEVYIFVIEINSLSEIGLVSDIVEKEKLSLDEVDWCGFLDRDECESRIFWRFKLLIQ